ncbi:MFS general substrate transporter [Xylaria sp. FL0043]|nr:MFS general substrate transporter [Xylaria sp. FL0043]
MTSPEFSLQTASPVGNNLSSSANYDGLRSQKISPLHAIEGTGEKGSEIGFPDLDETLSEDDYTSGLPLALLTGAVALSVFLTSLDQTIVGTAIPKITDEFHGLGLVSWYGAAYFLTFGGFQSSWGKIYKHSPLKETFLTTLVIFEVGSIICGAAPNAVSLIVGRAIAGLGGAGISTGGTTIIALSAEPRKRPILMGVIGVSYALAAVAGPLLGGVFSERVTWRWCFYINAPIGALVVVVILIFFRLPSARKHPEVAWKEKLLQTDPVGVILVAGSIISFLLALQYGGVSYAWDSSTVIGLLVGFVAILTVLVVWEYYQGEYAMLTPRLVMQRSLWAPALFQFFFAGGYFLLLYYLPIYFQSVKGASPIQSGVDNLPLIIAAGVFILAGGVTVSKTGHAVPFMALGAALGAVGTGLLYTLELHTSSARWIGYQVLLGASTAFPFQNCLNVVHANVKPEDIAIATSILYSFQVLGGAFSVAAAQSAFVNTLIKSLKTTAPTVDPAVVIAVGATQIRSAFTPDKVPGIVLAYLEGIKTAFAVGTGLAGAAFVLSLACPWGRLHSVASGTLA